MKNYQPVSSFEEDVARRDGHRGDETEAVKFHARSETHVPVYVR